MFEVFSTLFDYFRESEEVSHEAILAHLIAAGHDPWEIGCAANCLDALFGKQMNETQLNAVSPKAIRIFTPEEQNILPQFIGDFPDKAVGACLHLRCSAYPRLSFRCS